MKKHSEKGILHLQAEFLDSLSDGVFFLDREWNFIYINHRSAANIGYNPRDLIGQNLLEKFPEIFAAHEKYYRQAMTEQKTQYFELQGVLTDRQYGIAVYPLSRGIAVYWHDITDRKLLEQKLSRERDGIKQLLDIAGVLILVLNPEGIVTLANPSVSETLGYKNQEIVGKNWFDDFLPPGTRKRVKIIFRKVMAGDFITSERVENPVLTKQGKEKIIDWHNSVIRDKQGKITGTLSSGFDVTEHKHTRDALKRAKNDLENKIQERTKELGESEEKYRLLVENANEAVTVFQDGKIKFFNNQALEISGYSSEELAAKYFADLIYPDDREMVVERYLKRFRKENAPNSYEFRIIHKKGSTVWVNINAVVITWEGNPAILGILADITERKQMERVLREYAQRITQVQEEERKRIAFELHDDTAQYLSILKMQLNSLLNSEEITSPEVKKKLHFLEKDAERAFNDVRRYSHELRPGVLEHLGLLAALEQIAEDVNKLGQIRVEVTIEGEEFALSEEIKLGFFRIAQEAISNARKHSKASRADIHLDFRDKQVRMAVHDDGVGFDMQEVSHRTSLKGNLGLTSMNERAKLIGASLKIESQPGQGTTVTLEVSLNK
jgi:PAS domain S-box-containing protein